MIREVSAQELQQIIQTASLVLVDYSATWCGPCKLQHPILEQLDQQSNGKLTIVTIDVDKNKDFAKKHQIKAVPTIQFYLNGKLLVWKVEGQPIDRLTGVKSLKSLIGLINMVLVTQI